MFPEEVVPVHGPVWSETDAEDLVQTSILQGEDPCDFYLAQNSRSWKALLGFVCMLVRKRELERRVIPPAPELCIHVPFLGTFPTCSFEDGCSG